MILDGSSATIIYQLVKSFLARGLRLVELEVDVGRRGVSTVHRREIAREEEVLPLGTIALMVRSGTIVPVVNNFPLTNKPIVFIVGLNDTDK